MEDNLFQGLKVTEYTVQRQSAFTAFTGAFTHGSLLIIFILSSQNDSIGLAHAVITPCQPASRPAQLARAGPGSEILRRPHQQSGVDGSFTRELPDLNLPAAKKCIRLIQLNKFMSSYHR